MTSDDESSAGLPLLFDDELPFSRENDIGKGTHFQNTLEPDPIFPFARTRIIPPGIPGEDPWLQPYTYDGGWTDTRQNYMAISCMKASRIAQSSFRLRRKSRQLQTIHISHLLALPLDVVFEVLGHLHPIDLYHLSQSEKTFKNLLMSPDSVSLWRTTFERQERLPLWPSSISSPLKWADLLFGKAICEHCNIRTALPEFLSLSRCCTVCKSANLVYRAGFSAYYPPLKSLLLQMLPCTNRRSGTARYNHPIDRPQLWYWKPHINEFVEEYNKISEQDELRDAFFAECATRIAHTQRCQDWAAEVYAEMEEQITLTWKEVANRIRQFLLKKGYKAYDLETVEDEIEVLPRAISTSLQVRNWRSIIPAIKLAIQPRVERRKEDERRLLISNRTETLQTAYTAYINTQPPRLRLQLPGAHNILALREIRALIEDPSESDLHTDAAEKAIAAVGTSFAEQWMDTMLLPVVSECVQDLLSLLAPDSINNVGADYETFAPSKALLTETIGSTMVPLAIPVFVCQGCRSAPSEKRIQTCFFGMEEARNHLYCPNLGSSEGRLCWDRAGTHAVMTIIQLFGLDSGMHGNNGIGREVLMAITPRELDARNIRVLCTSCRPQHVSCECACGRKVVTWREFASHHSERHGLADQNSADPIATTLSPDALAYVLHREKSSADPRLKDFAWDCAHCQNGDARGLRYHDVSAHMNTTHSIDRPSRHADYIYMPRTPPSERRPLKLLLEPLADCVCLLCNKRGAYGRIYLLESVRMHLSDKHQVVDPVLDRDFRRIEIEGETSVAFKTEQD